MTTTNPENSSLDAARNDTLEAGLRTMHASLAALGPAIASVQVPVPPQMARGVQARENGWRRIEHEFRLLTAPQVADLLGSQSSNRNAYAADRRKKGQLLGVRRRNAYLYPGFQFDGASIHPLIPELIKIADRHHVEPGDLAQWLCLKTRQLAGDRPVDHLNERERVINAATRHFGVQW
ncbi:hypothetical protein [Arthrobacter castelli]|uniref:hypothetical protein n=1 Tax=Arthrobacter castelli TaxID=271431 RepID=UPI000410B49B|nr:hypothetical protein [Arthrobacter castelli]